MTAVRDILGKGNLIQDSNNKCEIHDIQMVKYPFGSFCPFCANEQIERENEALTKKYSDKRDKELADQYKLLFEHESMIADKQIKQCTLENYKPLNEEATENLKKAHECLNMYLKGTVFNLFIAGPCGTGKSHLAYGIARELSKNKKVIFLTMGELLRKVKSTFNKNSLVTEYDIINKLTKVDYLVIDDLGAECGTMDSDKKASDFINRVLFDVLEGRQGKSTIFTTNLSGKQIEQKYDERSYSRMFNNYQFIKFVDTKDYRKKQITFWE